MKEIIEKIMEKNPQFFIKMQNKVYSIFVKNTYKACSQDKNKKIISSENN